MTRHLATAIFVMACGAAWRPCWGQSERVRAAVEESDALGRLQAIRAAYASGRDEEVLVLADRAILEAAQSGGRGIRAGEFHFWRGAALRRMGRTEEALVAFDYAKGLGFREPELYLERSLAQKSLGRLDRAEQEWQEGERLVPDDLERLERLNLRRQQESREGSRLHVWLAPQLGYDSNVLGLREDTPLQQGDADFDSYFVGVYADARYFLVRTRNQLLWMHYQGISREYPNEPEVSYVDNVAALTGRQAVMERLDIEAKVSLEDAFLREEGHFRTQRAMGPALRIQPLEAIHLRLWGDWTHADYYESVPDEQDRDGTMGRLGVSAALDIGRGWSVSPSVTHVRYNAEGSDYDSRGWEVGLTVTPPEVLGLLIVPSLAHGRHDYEHPNSLTQFEKEREDRSLRVTLSVTIRALERLMGYAPTVSVSYVRQKSNVDAFDYSRWAPHVELGINVLSF
jgi:tetratricopeptide (TPR) repeat protein